jgi:hypothetical protein
VVTNASNQIKYQTSSATWNLFTINTLGYIDARGKYAVAKLTLVPGQPNPSREVNMRFAVTIEV